MKKILLTMLIAGSSLIAGARPAPSILDIKHSITDDNVVPPESFETQSRQLEENFYIQNYTARAAEPGGEKLGTDKEYETRLASLPTAIEMPYNQIVGRLINMYLGKKRGLVADMLALHSYYGNIFLEELLKEGMPTELQYLPVIESAINPNAVSRAGACGLWQFMPATAKGLGMEVNSLVDERRDPRVSSRNAARYLHQLYDIYGDWSLAIAAYNCGPGNVNKALRRAGGGKKDFWEIYNYLPAETRSYVPAFIAANYVMNFYNRHNIAPTVITNVLVTDTIKVNHRVHFRQIAEVLNIPVEEIRMLNPQFRQDIIPGNYRPYTLTLPRQQVLSYLMSEDAILAHDADLYAQRTYVEPGGAAEPVVIDESGDRNQAAADRQSENANQNMDVAYVAPAQVTTVTHVVTRGQSLKDIAKMYGVSATDIKRWNKLRHGKVKEGDHLVIETTTPASPESVQPQLAQNSQPSSSSRRSEVPAPPAKRRAAEAPEVPAPRAGRRYADTAQQQQAVPEPRRNNRSRAQEETAQQAQESTAKTSKKSRKDRNNQETQQPSTSKKSKKKTNSDSTDNNSRSSKKKKKQPRTTTYTVQDGDNLERIARRNGTTVEAIRQANGMKADETMIHGGQKLKMPGKESTSTSKKKKGKKNTTASSSKKKSSKGSSAKKTSSKKSSKKKKK